MLSVVLSRKRPLPLRHPHTRAAHILPATVSWQRATMHHDAFTMLDMVVSLPHHYPHSRSRRRRFSLRSSAQMRPLDDFLRSNTITSTPIPLAIEDRAHNPGAVSRSYAHPI